MVDHLWIKDESKVLTSNPPRYAWECARCGAVATTSGGMPSTEGCGAHASIELLRTWIGESGITLAERVQLGNLVNDVELRLKLAEGRRKTERNNFEQVCEQRDRLKEQRKVLQAEVDELREKVGRMAETDSRWEAMRRDLENTIAERDECYMRLPVDADGVPIRPGDKLVHGKNTIVAAFVANDYICTPYGIRVPSLACRLVKPDTVESLLEEFARKFVNTCQLTSEESVMITNYAERIRKAVQDGD